MITTIILCLKNSSIQNTIKIFFIKILKLQAAIKYGADELADAKSLVDKCPQNDPDTEINRACLLFKVCSENHILDELFNVEFAG